MQFADNRLPGTFISFLPRNVRLLPRKSCFALPPYAIIVLAQSREIVLRHVDLHRAARPRRREVNRLRRGGQIRRGSAAYPMADSVAGAAAPGPLNDRLPTSHGAPFQWAAVSGRPAGGLPQLPVLIFWETHDGHRDNDAG